MENKFEKSAVNAGQSAQYLTLSQPNLEKKKETLEMFWTDQRREMENVNDFKNKLLLPPTLIKKIMKKDEDVRMVELPILLAKACEMFIQDPTLRSWLNAEENHRRILKKDDLTNVIIQTNNFDFLLDVVSGDNATDPFTPSSVPFYAAGGSN